VCKAGDKEASPPVQSPKAVDECSLGDFMMVQVLEQLSAAGQEQREAADIIWDRASKTEISPWLEMTRWPSYLHEHLMV
jgi:hypothetical protein